MQTRGQRHLQPDPMANGRKRRTFAGDVPPTPPCTLRTTQPKRLLPPLQPPLSPDPLDDDDDNDEDNDENDDNDDELSPRRKRQRQADSDPLHLANTSPQ